MKEIAIARHIFGLIFGFSSGRDSYASSRPETKSAKIPVSFLERRFGFSSGRDSYASSRPETKNSKIPVNFLGGDLDFLAEGIATRVADLKLKIRVPKKMVEATGFEPTTSTPKSSALTGLRHAPNS